MEEGHGLISQLGLDVETRIKVFFLLLLFLEECCGVSACYGAAWMCAPGAKGLGHLSPRVVWGCHKQVPSMYSNPKGLRPARNLALSFILSGSIFSITGFEPECRNDPGSD